MCQVNFHSGRALTAGRHVDAQGLRQRLQREQDALDIAAQLQFVTLLRGQPPQQLRRRAERANFALTLSANGWGGRTTATRSQKFSISYSSWLMNTTVFRFRPTNSFFTSDFTKSAVWMSMLLVGSSRNKTGGSCRIARAMFSRWRWPVE